ncbi:MAG: hypothetical protein HQ517_14930 [SAR324 cluster bacterium]|nr:hypothetical protein [SAR324 cluster bacterium]
MLKKIMKAALAASLVIGFSAVAMAEANVSGDVHSYFGQAASGVEGSAGRFAVASEGHVNVTGNSGSLSGFLQLETRDDRYGANSNINNAQLNVAYTADALSVKLGTVNTGIACTYAISNGLGTTTTVGYGTYIACMGYLEQDGIQLQYAIPAIKGAVQLTIAPHAMGQKVAIGATGTLADMVGFRFNQTTDTADDYSVDTDTAASDSYMHIGFKLPMGAMSFSLDISTATLDNKTTSGSNAFQFRMAELGPGTLAVTLAQGETKFDGNPVDKTGHTGLSYLIGLDKGARADFFYAAKTVTPEGGTAVTASYVGGGLNLSF